jgi:hypothetical protein
MEASPLMDSNLAAILQQIVDLAQVPSSLAFKSAATSIMEQS